MTQREQILFATMVALGVVAFFYLLAWFCGAPGLPGA